MPDNWLDRAIGFVAPRAAARRVKARHQLDELRAYSGAALGRHTGLAVEDACADARARLFGMAAEVLGVLRDQLALAAGGISAAGGHVSFRDLMHQYFGVDSGEVVGQATVTPRYRDGDFARAANFS